MTNNSKSILILAGDGIGSEIVQQAERVIDWVNENNLDNLVTSTGLIGGASYDEYGVPLADETLSKCHEADAILMGSVGGTKWDNVEYDKRPEAGLLRLRKDMELFANLRPALVFDSLIDASSLKPDIIRGLDILIIRELTGGVYFGEPRGIENLENGERLGVNTHSYTTSEIHRISKIGFDMARKRSGRVHSCEKANVMEAGKLWREEVTALHMAEYSDIELTHMYADNCAMQLLRDPKQFDVILTDNLFGDILSDEASMLTGSLGMLPSASLGVENPKTGYIKAVYEPVHGSAPDIAGQNKANPLATILSLAMLFRYSFNSGDIADIIEQAVSNVLKNGYRTADILDKDNLNSISTTEMGNAVIKELTILHGSHNGSCNE